METNSTPTSESVRPMLVPVVYVMLLREGAVLLQLRRGTGYMDGYWAAAAAGHLEAGESVLDAAVREAREETGVSLHRDGLTPICAMHRTQRSEAAISERVDFFLSCVAWRGEPSICEPSKATDLQWFALDELPGSVVPHERFVLDGIRSGDLPAIVDFGFSPR